MIADNHQLIGVTLWYVDANLFPGACLILFLSQREGGRVHDAAQTKQTSVMSDPLPPTPHHTHTPLCIYTLPLKVL